MPLMKTQQS